MRRLPEIMIEVEQNPALIDSVLSTISGNTTALGLLLKDLLVEYNENVRLFNRNMELLASEIRSANRGL